MHVDDLTGHAGKDGWLTALALLVVGLEPVPALRTVGGHRLGRIEHATRLLFGQPIHGGPCSEVVRILRTAMQHDHQRQCLPVIATGEIQLVLARAGLIGKATGGERAGRRWRAGAPSLLRLLHHGLTQVAPLVAPGRGQPDISARENPPGRLTGMVKCRGLRRSR